MLSPMYSKIMSTPTLISELSFFEVGADDTYLQYQWPFKSESIINIERAIYI